MDPDQPGKDLGDMSCDELVMKMKALIDRDPSDYGGGGSKGLKQRFEEQINGRCGPGTPSWKDHEEEFEGRKRGLSRVKRLYDRKKCTLPLPDDLDEWLEKDPPGGADYKGKEHPKDSDEYRRDCLKEKVPVKEPEKEPSKTNEDFMRKMQELTGLTGVALIIYLIISEGSRLFPPRNLVPVL
jgi:hypothetical protein